MRRTNNGGSFIIFPNTMAVPVNGDKTLRPNLWWWKYRSWRDFNFAYGITNDLNTCEVAIFCRAIKTKRKLLEFISEFRIWKKKKGKRREREFKSEFNAVVCFWHVTHSQSIFYEPVRSNLSVSCVFCASCALRNGKILSTYQVKPGVARYRRENCQTQMQALVFLGH